MDISTEQRVKGSPRLRRTMMAGVAACTMVAGSLTLFSGVAQAGNGVFSNRPTQGSCNRPAKYVLDAYYGTFLVDSDGDGLSDQYELNVSHTDPCKSDTDGDGLSDGCEVLANHSNPLDPNDPPRPGGPRPRPKPRSLFPF